MPNFHIQKGARKGAPASTKFPSLIFTARGSAMSSYVQGDTTTTVRFHKKKMVHGKKKQHHQMEPLP